ncbi:MAG: hypothetical protein R2750_01505 [Bacteroidales bacterium]
MNPRIGQRSQYNRHDKKPLLKAVEFVQCNTKKNITMKQEFLYLEDVKTAMNIQYLEERIRMRKWMMELLAKDVEKNLLIKKLEELLEKDRHVLQKTYRISI